LAEERIPRLNEGQRAAFDEIVKAVNDRSGKTFFLHGPGGTGKTYVYNTLGLAGHCSAWQYKSQFFLKKFHGHHIYLSTVISEVVVVGEHTKGQW